MSRFERIWATSAVALAFAVVGVPSSAGAQQGGASTVAPQDSAAKDSVAKAAKDSFAKAQRAECAAANKAMMMVVQKKKEQQAQQRAADSAQAKDSTQPNDSTQSKKSARPKNNASVSIAFSDSDLPPGITMQTLMRCMQGGAARRTTPAKPKQQQADTGTAGASGADTAKAKPSKD